MLALTLANLKMMARNRQTTFWALFFPLLLVVVFGLFEFNTIGSASVVVMEADGDSQRNSARGQLLKERLADLEFLQLRDGPGTEDEARRQVAGGDLDYLLIVPREESAPVTLVYASRNRQRNQLVDGAVRDLVATTQPADRPAPPASLVVSEVIEVTEVSYFDKVLLGLVGLGIATNSIISIAVRISTYRNQSILKRLLVTPLPIWKYFGGEVAAHLVLALAQAAIILAVGVLVFGAQIHGNPAWIFVIVVLGTLVFLNIGFILSAWANTPAAASGMGNAVALPMIFFAGTFFSTATLPWVLPQLAQVLPLTPMLEALRQVALDSAPLWETWPQLVALAGWVVATGLLATRVFRFS